MFLIMWLVVYLFVVLGDCSCVPCAAVASVCGVRSFSYRLDGVCVLLSSI